MRRKWASISSKGTLTLARDLLQLPKDLVDHIICHELLHLKIPTHNRGFHAMLSAYIPDWQERELCLEAWVLTDHADVLACGRGFHHSMAMAAGKAIAAPKKIGAGAPNPRQPKAGHPSHSHPAMSEAGKSSSPSTAL
jgi:hypothetical protein